MTDNRNMILAVILSGVVLLAWQYFYNVPQMERQRAQQAQQAELQKSRTEARRHDVAVEHATAARQHRAVTGRPGRFFPRGRRQPRSGAGRIAARQDRDPEPDRQHLAEGRAHRRSLAGQVPRHRRPGLAGDRAVFAVRHRRALLRRVRLGARRRLDRARARPQHRVAAGKQRRADADLAGRAEIRQWRRPHLPPHHLGRRPLSLHHQGRRQQCRQRAGDALSVRADLAPRRAAGLRLLHPA